MSPVRKPSDRGLRTGAAQPARDTLREVPAGSPPPKPEPEKKARITLNLTPEMYRQLIRWADTSAEAIDVPRVPVQDALRVMIRVITSGEARNAEMQIQAALREELAK